ncbi:MAG: ABC transporter ATP-binding protein/permease [Succinivibrio sp.]|nr:ABC transporter ATP-binding protein/permease [Succinivibrio sp.]
MSGSVNQPKAKSLRGHPGAMFAEVEHAQQQGVSLRRLSSYFFQEKLTLTVILTVVLGATLLAVLAPNLQSQAIDIIARKREGVLLYAVLWMLGAYLGANLLSFVQGLLCARLGQRVILRLRAELFDKIIKLPIGYLDRHPHGDLLSRMTNDVENISGTISQAIPAIISASLTILGTAGFMLYLCWQLALLAFLTIFITVCATKFLARRIRSHSRERQTLLGELNAQCEESITYVRTLTAYNRQEETLKQFCTTSDRLTQAGIRTEIYSGIMGPVMNCIGNLEFVIIAVAGALFALEDLLTIGVISAFIVYAKQFSRPVNEISMIYGQIQTALAGAERVFKVLDESSEPEDGQDLLPQEQASVSFQQVSFAYQEGQPVLKELSLEVKAGSKIALVGATGSGKTTLANLLLRFYDVTSGRILLNGVDIQTYSRRALRELVAIVLQDTVFFSDSIRNNLKFGREEASDAELQQALQLSYAKSFVDKLPQGLGTVLEDAGGHLSQGQRQLLSIARAFVSQPKILILDEATSNVDTLTEQAIEDAVEKIMEGRTCFIIAHRLSTIRNADLIVVLDQGRLVECGRHAELLSQKGKYYELCKSQFEGFAI